MEVLEQESEEKRVARLKELEDMVKRLKSENKQLLNKVNSSGSSSQDMAVDVQKKGDGSGKMGNKTSRGGPLPADDLDTDILDLEESEGEVPPADEWLFVSPKLPPTPAHKKMSPVQWLSEGHNRNRETGVPSLSDVRKTLVFSMDEAENLVNSSRVVPGTESPPTSPSMNGKRSPSNRTAQKYLQQVRQRRNSPPASHSPSGGGSPTLGIRPTSNRTRVAAPVQRNNAGAVPVVKWTPKEPSESPPPLSDEEVEEIPKGRWNVKQVPSNNPPLGGGENLKVKWDPSMANDFSSDEDEEIEPESRVPVDNDVPVVKWNAKLPKDSKSRKAKLPVEVESGGGDVPIVKWQAKVPKANDEAVPVVKNWRAKVPAESKSRNEDVPVVKWPAAKMPAEAGPRGEDVPVVKWLAAKVPADESVPVVKWQTRSPNSSGASSPNTKRGIGSPRGRGRGLAPPSRRTASAHDESENSEEGILNGESEFSGSEGSMDNLRVSRYSAHQSGLQRRGGHSASSSRSPQTRHSPKTSGGRSGSPSPPEGSSPRLQNSHVSRLGLASPRQGGSPLRNLSPSSQGSNSSVASTGRSPSNSPGRGLKVPRSQLQTSASAPNQRSPPGGKAQSGLSNSRGLQAPRAQQVASSNLRGSSSAPSTVRGGLTPPTGGQGKSRQLPAIPGQAGNGSRGQVPAQQRVKQTTSAQKQSPKRATPQRGRPVPQQQAPSPAAGDDDDSWLEGCF